MFRIFLFHRLTAVPLPRNGVAVTGTVFGEHVLGRSPFPLVAARLWLAPSAQTRSVPLTVGGSSSHASISVLARGPILHDRDGFVTVVHCIPADRGGWSGSGTAGSIAPSLTCGYAANFTRRKAYFTVRQHNFTCRTAANFTALGRIPERQDLRVVGSSNGKSSG